MHDRIEVPLDLEGFVVTASALVGEVLEVSVESTNRPACHHCGSVRVVGHGRCERRIRDRAYSYPTVLRWSQRRIRCIDCRRTCRERHPEVAGRRTITKRFRRHLYERAVSQPFAHVAATEGVSGYRVVDAFDWHSLEQLRIPLSGMPEVISIDESAFRKRWRYHTVISDPEGGGAFEMFEGRDERVVTAVLLGLSPQVRAGIRAVVMDLFWPYRKAVENALPHAAIVADKFHVIAALSRAANDVRRRCGRRQVPLGIRTGRPVDKSRFRRMDPEVFATKWIFMKRAAKLTDDERDRLDRLFVRFPEIGVAWLLRESFAAFYDAPDCAEARRRLELWETHLSVACVPELQRCWSRVGLWRETILAYFEWPVTNAFAEGITNKIKVIKRSSYGFGNIERYRCKVLLACGRRGR